MLTLLGLSLVILFMWIGSPLTTPFLGMALTATLLMVLSIGSFFYQYKRLLQIGRWISPEAVRVLQQDTKLNSVSAFWLVVALILIGATALPADSAFIVWILLTALSLDAWLYYRRRAASLSTPEGLLAILSQEGEKNAQKGSVERVKESIGILSDIAERALRRSLSTFSVHVIEEMENVLDTYMAASEKERLLHAGEEEWLQTNEKQVNYILCLFSERLEGLFRRALSLQAEPVLTRLITAAGGAALATARVDMHLVSVPLYGMEQMEQAAEAAQRSGLTLKFVLTLIEVARGLSRIPHVQLLEIGGAYLPLILQIEKISKGRFKEDKKIPLSSLTQPLYDVRAILEEPPLDTHRNSIRIIAEINRILAEFQELERILMTIPGIPGYDVPHAEH